ncbi:MAG: M4 family metallopeptidase [Bacteroidetes bacterium]|nr:M4 family metallopeptidase [Bacteroidota bacterium]
MTKFLRKLAFLLVFSGLLIGNVFSQENIKHQVIDDNGNPKFIQLKEAVNFDSKSTNLLTEYLDLNQEDSYALKRSEKDKLGQVHYRYQQYYRGIKVEHGRYIVHTSGEKATSLNGDYKLIPANLVTEPKLTEAQALQKALNYVNAKEYMWENNEAFAKLTEPSKTFYPQGEKVIVENDLSDVKEENTQLHLAYKFNIYAADPVSRAYIYVDAITGKILMKDDIIKKVAATGQADTRYSGLRTIYTDNYDGNYRLRDYTRGDGIIIWDMNQGTDYASAVDFIDNDNTWSAAEFDNAEKDDIAMEASWAFANIYDYWMNVHGRDSYDNQGSIMNAYVHYDVAYDNAYWNGSVFTFGDGSDTYFDALASLDVSAHEHGHGVCSYTADLVYSKESGALNEAFSDIWGACLEAYAAPEKMIWIMGEDIERRDGHLGLRSLSDPKSEGLPDTYLGEYWVTRGTDNGGVHTNNGPFCYWFYLISEGGSGVNDNGDAYSVSPIGIEKAEQIAYRTESVYMTASSQYADARVLTIQAAEDLYGVGSYEVIQVTNAMYAIGVGDEYSGGTTDTEAPTAPANLTASNITSSSVDLTWTASTDNIGVNGYDIYKDNAYLASSTSTSYSVSGLSASTSYNFYVKAKDAAGNISTASNTVNVTTSEAVVDTEAPTAPANLTASNITSSSVDLTWTAATDNIGVTGYDVYQDDAYLASTTSTSYGVSGLSASTAYSFYVKAKDAAGNISGASNTLNVTTDEATGDLPMVSSITLTVTRQGRRYYGRSTINVSSEGNPVSNAYVEITWSGAYNGTSTGYTDASGNLVTTVTVTGTDLTVTIDNITAAGYYWDTANSEVSETYSSFAYMPTIEATTYPNPCASEVNFIIEHDFASIATISLFDITGKQIINKQVEIMQGNNLIKIDVEYLDTGIYLYQISTEAGISTGKIMKK